MNTIDDKQIEKGCFGHYNEFEYIQDFLIVLSKSDDAFLVFGVLDNNICFYLIDYYKFLFFINGAR